jgi:chromate transporter
METAVVAIPAKRSPSPLFVPPCATDRTAAETSASAAETPVTPVTGPPPISLGALFLLFVRFGLRAFGGPVAQIGMLREELVLQGRWISDERFKRVLAVYQVLPGPEATEMCCYFGMVARGRLGAVLAGLGFLLPGFGLMLAAAALYDRYGARSAFFSGPFEALQPAVTAMVFRAVHKIGEGTLRDHAPAAASPSWARPLVVCAVRAGLESVLGVNFFISLVTCGIYLALHRRRRQGRGSSAATDDDAATVPLLRDWPPLLTSAGLVAAVALELAGSDLSRWMPQGLGIGRQGRGAGPVFLVGLMGGLLTFGGAYTAIPLVRAEAVTGGAWMSTQAFLDGVALASVLPAPLVIFSTFVGYMAAGVVGAVLSTVGMFLPAFAFTLIGHNFFERAVEAKGAVAHALDGVAAGVTGLIAVTAVQLLRSAIVRPQDPILFVASLAVLYKSKHRFTPVAVVAAAALCGRVLYSPLPGQNAVQT